MFENPRTGRQARNFKRNVPKILDLKSSSEQMFSESWRWVPLQFTTLKKCRGKFECLIYEMLLIRENETDAEHSKFLHSSETVY